jgi:hypothetical protein
VKLTVVGQLPQSTSPVFLVRQAAGLPELFAAKVPTGDQDMSRAPLPWYQPSR